VVNGIKAEDYVFDLEEFEDSIFTGGASVFIQPATGDGWDQHLDIDSILPTNYGCAMECSYIAEGRSQEEARKELIAIGMKEENLL
jgi:hypothetical protein